MARENLVMLHGQVVDTPKIYAKDDGHPTKAIFVIKVIRRPTNSSQLLANKLYLDCPIICTRNEEMIKQAYKLSLNDMVDIKGVLCTREVTKVTKCPHCGHQNQAKGNSVYVNPLYICKRESGAVMDGDNIVSPGITPADGLALLKQRSEISNLVMLLGELCRNPESYIDDQGREYAQYQIAVNRKYRIPEDPVNLKTDYPWIKTFGAQAKEDMKFLQMSSRIYINGALQTREVIRHTVCEECGEVYDWSESVTEVVPYSPDYIDKLEEPDLADDIALTDEDENNGETES